MLFERNAAGTPLADLVFVIAMARILEVVSSRLCSSGLLHVFDASGAGRYFADEDCEDSISFPENCSALKHVSYVDDLEVPVIGTASTVVSKLAAATVVVHDVFWQFGLDINLAPGKTCAIIKLAGPGSKSVRLSLASDDFHIHCTSTFGRQFRLPIVQRYKHLGSTVTAELSLAPELAIRGASMVQAIRPISVKCFGSDDVPLKSKMTIVRKLGVVTGALQLRHLASSWYQ